jgi:Protein kinase domain
MPALDPPTIVVKEQSFRGTLAPGTVVGSYRLVSVLGQGGFGITYLAQDEQLKRRVAIKEYLAASLAIREADTIVVPRSTEVAEEFMWGRDRFIEEARTLARLGSVPSIIPVYDFLEANGTAYMVMAFAEGETLNRRLRDGRRLAPDEVDQLIHPLMDGLSQVHEAGFVHRDIKPDNIILDAEGKPTLIDFGASRAPVAGRTGAMTAIFTPGYAAAEQFTSGKQGPWTDIYGLSATLYHAISGSPPPNAFDRMLDDEYVSLASLRPAGFSLGLLAALDAGLALRPGERPRSIAAWRPFFSGAAVPADRTVLMSPLRGKEPSRLPARRTRPAPYAAGAVASVLIVAGAGYLLWKPAGPVSPPTQASALGPGAPATGATASTPANATAPAPARPAELSQMFDGKWSVYTICDAFQGQQGFEHTYEMTVKDGVIHGEDGLAGEAGSGALTGWIAANGDVTATYAGKVGETRKIAADAAVGSPVTFNMTGHVYDGRGSAKQNTFRPCSITFVQLDDPNMTPNEPASGQGKK